MVAILLLSAQKVAYSVVTITIAGSHGMAYGSVVRSASSTVAYGSGSAAQFVVTGSKNNGVYLAVTQTAVMTTTNGSSTIASRRQISQTLSATTCKYSVDGGSTWNNFSGVSSGYIWVATSFPKSGGTTSSILVRVGGMITASSVQQRGSYSGNITLSAQYN